MLIGNDLVDLAQARKDSTIFRRGYFEKVLTSFEYNLVETSKYPELMFWKIWASKETVYKAAQRQLGFKRFYNPKLFEVQSIGQQHSYLKFRNIPYAVNITVDERLIYSKIQSSVKLENCVCKSKKEVISALNTYFKTLVTVQKDGLGLPYLQVGANKHLCSITHHGMFFAIQYEC